MKKDINVTEFNNNAFTIKKKFKQDGQINVSYAENNVDFNALTNNLKNISNDKTKLDFMNLAYNALYNKNALKELKTIIKGIELIMD